MTSIAQTAQKTISYSVIVRTLGNSGEKYEALLRSIKAQTIQPEEIIVVIPDGYDLDYTLGNETILRSPKGMVIQRAMGIEAAHTDYLLVVDDDIEFESDFVDGLASFLNENKIDCVLPCEGIANSGETSGGLYYSLTTRLKYALTGRMFQTKKASRFLDVITTTAGHKVYCGCNDPHGCYYCQTGCFQCFFIDTAKAKRVSFRDESWLQQGTISQYAAYDDATFFYSFYLLGFNIAYSLRTHYKHLDAAAGRSAKNNLEAKRIRNYSRARNRTVFWYRFLFQTSDSIQRRIMVVIGGLYAFINTLIFNLVVNIHPKNWPVISALFQGYKEAFSIIKHKTIPPHGLKNRVD